MSNGIFVGGTFELKLVNDFAAMECTIMGKLPPERNGWVCLAIGVDVKLTGGGFKHFVVPIILPDEATTMDLALALVAQMKVLSSHANDQAEDEKDTLDS